MYGIWAKALATRSNTIVDAIKPRAASNPDNVKRVERVFTESDWDYLTQMAAPEYTYERFLRAVGKFPAFAANIPMAAMPMPSAKIHHHRLCPFRPGDRRPHRQGEYLRQPAGAGGVAAGAGARARDGLVGGADRLHHRLWPERLAEQEVALQHRPGLFHCGAKQLSYHFNYGAFSEAMFDGDASVLLNNPGLVADSWLNLASAIWFFLTPQAPKPAMLHVIDRTWVPSQREIAAGIGYGFGTTINVINGGIECGEQNKNKGQPVNRIRYWEGLAEHYQIPVKADEKNTCWQQTPMAASTSTVPPTCSTPTGTATGNTIRIGPAATRLNVSWWGSRPPTRHWYRGLREVRDQLLRLPRQLAQGAGSGQAGPCAG